MELGALETTVKGLAILFKAGDSSEGLKQGNGVFQSPLWLLGGEQTAERHA